MIPCFTKESNKNDNNSNDKQSNTETKIEEINQHFKRLSLFSKTTIQLNETSKIQFSAGGFGSTWNASGQIPERAVEAGIIYLASCFVTPSFSLRL